MSTETMRYATGNQPAARALGATAACWHAIPAAASTLEMRPKAIASSSKQATWVHVTDFGPRPPLRSSP
jgi:hypothetical protein